MRDLTEEEEKELDAYVREHATFGPRWNDPESNPIADINMATVLYLSWLEMKGIS